MDEVIQSELLKAFQEGLSPLDNRPIYEWASDHVKLSNVYSVPGYFSAEKSRFMLRPLDSMKDIRIREIACMASPRCGKSLIAELFLLHTIINNAGTTGWFSSSDEQLDKFAELRLIPLLSSCKQVKDMLGDDRFSVTKKRFVFPHMTVSLSSAKIKALQSIGYKTIIGDECWLWDVGYIGEAKARLGDFLHTSKFVLLSQGSEEGDDWDNEFGRGEVYEWSWQCPSCQKMNTYDWQKQREDGTYAGVVWDKNDKTCKDGIWDIQEAGKTAKFECFHCRHQLMDTPQNRRHMNDHGDYVKVKDGIPSQHSYRWNAMANIEIPLSMLAMEYLQAKAIFKREGSVIALKEFYQKRLAKPFKKNYGVVDMVKLVADSYSTEGQWGDYRFMTVDCQNNFQEFYYVIRDWKKTGESRLVKHGRVPTWTDLRAIQKQYEVKDQSVAVDSGNFGTQVYAKCLEFGHAGMYRGKKTWFSWIALKGWDSTDFEHPEGVKKLYSVQAQGDPNLGKEAQGKTCPLYRWSNYSIKNILTHLRDGKGVSWQVNTDDEQYQRQMNSEVLMPVLDKRTNKEKQVWVQRTGIPNHYFDCECQQIVLAAMVGILGHTF